jgi:hypothetical protein
LGEFAKTTWRSGLIWHFERDDTVVSLAKQAHYATIFPDAVIRDSVMHPHVYIFIRK